MTNFSKSSKCTLCVMRIDEDVIENAGGFPNHIIV